MFLDRDGVLNEPIIRGGRPYPPTGVKEAAIVSDAESSLTRLKRHGFLLIVVTNQPDVRRGATRSEDVEEIHRFLSERLPVDDFFVCYHDDRDQCRCRKPRPGLLLEAAAKYGIDPDRSYLVGDRWRDIEAGAAAGCRTVLIDYGYNERAPKKAPDASVCSLSAAVDWILNQEVEIPTPLSDLKVKLFADGADRDEICQLYRNPIIRGFTTNPTLMRKAGISEYEQFARDVLAAIPDRPISFEVFSDDFAEMERQAHKIASWGRNVFVKIPVTNTRRDSSIPLICRLSQAGVKLNTTALMTLEQVKGASRAMRHCPAGYISVFAGRIADTGRDPVPVMREAVHVLHEYPNLELIWASPRELLNVFQADAIGCHVITATNDILKKLCLVGKDLDEYSLDTVKMFRDDAVKAGFLV